MRPDSDESGRQPVKEERFSANENRSFVHIGVENEAKWGEAQAIPRYCSQLFRFIHEKVSKTCILSLAKLCKIVK